MLHKLDEIITVTGQIDPAAVPSIAAQGFRLIINNRPDGEQPGQPLGDALAAAAQRAGLEYIAIPIDQSGFSPAQVAAMATALAKADGPVLAFCRSGTRSTFAWALARLSEGADFNELAAKAMAAGYDISPLDR
jgi:uncharacterized protein (TIGR01244 family)